MSATILDIARATGKAYSTVSRALHDSPLISVETRKLVRAAAEKLGYHPNISARILRGGASGIIGILIDPGAPSTCFVLLSELERCADKRGLQVLISEAHESPEKLYNVYRSLLQSGADGVISLAANYPGLNDKMTEYFQNEPHLIFMEKPPFPARKYVYFDCEKGIEIAVLHLRENGCRRIALASLCGNENDLFISCRDRIRSFARHCPDGILVNSEYHDNKAELFRSAEKVADELLASHVDGVICQNDQIAAATMKVLLKRGARIPEDIKMVGFDDSEYCDFLPVPLTSVRFDQRTAAEKALTLLLDDLAGKKTKELFSWPVIPELVVRESSTISTII